MSKRTTMIIFGSILLSGLILNVKWPILTGYPILLKTTGAHEFFPSSARSSWNATFGGPGDDDGFAILAGENGNVYMTGYTTSFGAGGYDAFLSKFNENGTQLWNTTWGGGCCEEGKDIVIDGNGDLFVVGETSSFGQGVFDALIVKYAPTGTQLWNCTWGGVGTEQAEGIAIDGNDDIYITGFTNSSAFDNYDMFIAKFAGNGTQLWNRTWGSTGNEFGQDIALDQGNNVYVTGGGNEIGFLVKFSANGTTLWNRTLESTSFGRGITTDANGTVYVTASTNYIVGIGNGALIATYSATGTLLQRITYNPTTRIGAYTIGYGIVVNAQGQIYLSGTINRLGFSDTNAFVVIYSSSWDVEWTGVYSSPFGDLGQGIALDETGNIYLTGWTYPNSTAERDAFIIKNPPELVIEESLETPGFAPILIVGITVMTVIAHIFKQTRRKFGVE